MTSYSTLKIGKKYSPGFKTYVTQNGKIVSPFHDIPLHMTENREVISVICEIPRFENGKFEINKKERFNPIKQDVKNGKPRFVKNVFPMKGYLWNYGAIPQTWESPHEIDKHVGAKGDNDPLDVIEIGGRKKKIGEVYQAKVLGSIALVDEDECDWKVIVIDVCDEKANEMNDIEDVQKMCGGLLEQTKFWFENYKVPDGKGKNSFALDGKYMNKEFTLKVIGNAHESWCGMVNSKDSEDICKENSTLMDKIDPPAITGEDLSDSEIPDYVNQFEFIK
ncbi:inorganic pyrophosphatase [Encephalitozoon intestinalis ATCC 50506]|uniref:inorganic diphosphatase n=1 Tax=Encephalitozoon intestinalis (strain ATCC 50506) TaxID=876142 RepID=E0S9H1_ENCIT|nr:inorganic pyrophosphatase [Encephalitozoon intestinalis ATCC 50506]ADM12356.1 inorganic pyrophosphatase [Encephalitozoon intestinalis ATCC 50506]UTX46186.1 inorganic pyrophosphatase [Encephalitozoon intestinalis]